MAYLVSFILPKVYYLYLFEILVILKVIFNLKGLSQTLYKKRYSLYFIFTTSFVFYEFQVFLFSIIYSSYIDFDHLIAIVKFTLYFYISPYLYFGKLPNNYIFKLDRILFIHFVISCLILIYSLLSSPLETLLWQANTFGSRFVGLTGTSLTENGFELIGSTANSVGVLYVFFLFHYLKRKENKYWMVLVCILGFIMSFSQSSILLGIIILLYFLSKKIKNFDKKYLLFFLLTSLSILIIGLKYNIFFRIQNSIFNLFQGGNISSFHDRYLQWKIILNNINSFDTLLFGQSHLMYSPKYTNAIAESYFLNKLKYSGIIGLLFSFGHFYLFVKLFNKSSTLNYNFFWIIWFLSVLFLNNTFETDFIILNLVLIFHYNSYHKNKCSV